MPATLASPGNDYQRGTPRAGLACRDGMPGHKLCPPTQPHCTPPTHPPPERSPPPCTSLVPPCPPSPPGLLPAEEKKPREEKLVHSLDILEAFATLSVEVPTTRDAMPGLLADVAAKKEHFLAK